MQARYRSRLVRISLTGALSGGAGATGLNDNLEYMDIELHTALHISTDQSIILLLHLARSSFSPTGYGRGITIAFKSSSVRFLATLATRLKPRHTLQPHFLIV
jgi:hypothetical protein